MHCFDLKYKYMDMHKLKFIKITDLLPLHSGNIFFEVLDFQV